MSMVGDLVDAASNSCNADLTSTSFDYATSEAILHTLIQHCMHNLDQPEDSLVWKGLFSPSFTTKVIYNLMWLDSHSHNNPLIPELRTTMKILQVKVIPPRVKIFIWRALNNGLTSRDILAKYGMSIDPLCPLCGMDNETLDHLFITCQYSRYIWAQVGCAVPPPSSLAHWQNYWWKKPFNTPMHDLPAVAFAAITTWFIWKSQCIAVFNGSIPSPKAILTLAEVYARLQSPGMTSSGSPFNISSPSFWTAPPPNVIKINVDATSQSNCSAFGVIARDHLGHHIVSFCTFRPPLLPLDAEAHALLTGLRLAVSFGWMNIILESDCLDLVLMLHGVIDHPYQLSATFGECWALFKSLDSSYVSHVRRSGNYYAHNLAQYACKYKCTSFSDTWDSPDHICNQILLNAM